MFVGLFIAEEFMFVRNFYGNFKQAIVCNNILGDALSQTLS